MRKLAYFVLVVMTFCYAACGGSPKNRPTEIQFRTDFEKARAEAMKTGKPMIIDFYTDWCRWCKTLDTVTYADSLVIAMSEDEIFVKINAEVDTALARRFNISGYPTIVLARPDGEEIDRIWGFVPPTDFYNQIQLYLQGKETLEDFLSRLEDEPENLQYLSIIGDKYASRAESEKAVQYYRKVVELDADNEQGFGARAMASIHDTQSRSRDYAGAIETCRELTRRFPDSGEADDAAALVAYYTAKMGDQRGALKLYREYLERYPDGRNVEWVRKRVADLEMTL